jgi:thiol-disulfide isomerase/thioredoxin
MIRRPGKSGVRRSANGVSWSGPRPSRRTHDVGRMDHSTQVVRTGLESVDRGGVLLIVVVAVVSALLGKVERQGYHSTLVPGDPMPDYSALLMDGTRVSIRDFEGTVVLLNFWATLCSSCVEQFPGMQIIKQEFEGRGLDIISVNLDKGDRASVQESWDLGGYGWLNLFDDPSRVEGIFGWGDRYPKTVLVNRDGTVGVW